MRQKNQFVVSVQNIFLINKLLYGLRNRLCPGTESRPVTDGNGEVSDRTGQCGNFPEEAVI